MARLALLIPTLAGGGAEMVTLSLAKHFTASGHEVDLVAMDATGELRERVPPTVRLFDLNVRRFRSSLFPLIRYLRERRPDALHAAMWPLTIVAILAVRLSRRKMRVIVSDHSILSKQYGGSARMMLRLSTRLLYPLANARICVSKGAAADLANISGIRADHFTVIYNPVELPPDASAVSEQVEDLWGSADRRILTVGNLKEAKDHELLIRAFAVVDKQVPAKLVIVGEGEERPALERLIDALRLNGKVILPGFIANPRPFYASADLFVLSSKREGFGNSLVEAMLERLPVVSTDCEGPNEILDGGRFGRLVPLNDVEALAQAMREALEQSFDPSAARQRATLLSSNNGDRYLELLLGDRSIQRP